MSAGAGMNGGGGASLSPPDLALDQFVEPPEAVMQVEEKWVIWKEERSAHQTLLSQR